MTTEQRIAIQLLKSAVTGEPETLPENAPIRAVQELMMHQGVTTMGYIGAVNSNLPVDNPMMLRLLDFYCAATVQSEQQLLQIQKISQAFEENGIHYMPVKGAIMKYMYPNHELRGMSDADILIREAQYPQIRTIMTELGFVEQGESDHEHIWAHEYLNVELHKRLMPTYNKDYYQYFGVGWDLAKIQNGYRWSMTHEDAFIYDLIHFAKHYRDAEANCRFVVDLWVHLRTYPDLDMAYIRQEMQKMGMESFFDNMMQVINAWFQDGPWDERTERITEMLFNDNEQQRKDLNLIAKSVRAEENMGSAKSRPLRAIFPDRDHMNWSYPQWKKVPLPLAWVLRWFQLVFFRRKSIQKRTHEKKVTRQDMDNYRQDLEYVGLEFSNNVVLPE